MRKYDIQQSANANRSMLGVRSHHLFDLTHRSPCWPRGACAPPRRHIDPSTPGQLLIGIGSCSRARVPDAEIQRQRCQESCLSDTPIALLALRHVHTPPSIASRSASDRERRARFILLLNRNSNLVTSSSFCVSREYDIRQFADTNRSTLGAIPSLTHRTPC